MMRPKAIKGAGALDYYAKLVPEHDGEERWAEGQAEGRDAVEDYYLPLNGTPGEWFGAGAARLGLEGDGHRDQMAALLEGLDPNTGEKLGQRPRPDGVRAYDLTFSAPKSVSVLAGIVGGATEREVVAAHDAAVKAALGVLEERATTRAGKNGVHRLDAGGLTSLLVRHRTSRSLDPQLHTHALVFAKVQAADGRWRALDAGIVFRAQRLFGAAYQSALRSELTARLGVEWGEVVKGQAELTGLEPGLLAAFSRRSEQVARAAEEALAAWRAGHPGREPTERERAIVVRDAAKDSRPAKDHSRPPGELRAEHLAIAAEHGWDTARVAGEVLARAPAVQAREEITAAGEALIARDVVGALSGERSVWSVEQVERAVLERLPSGDGRDAKAQLREAQRVAADITRGLCLDLAELAAPARDPDQARAENVPGARAVLEDPGVERYTTRELLEQEQRILRWFEHSAALGGQPANAESLARAASVGGLDAEQAQAAALVAGTDRAVVIVGPAGTGKTTTLRPAVEALQAGGRDVLGLAPSAVAAETLGRDTGVGSENVAMFLTLHDGGDPPERVALRRGGTLLIDEAGMLGTTDLERVLRVAERDGLRVALIGDGRQLFAVGRGGMFDQAREIVPVVEFGQVYRFGEDWERPASLALRAGKPEAIAAYSEHGRVRSGTAVEMNTAILEDYLAARAAGRSTAFSVATNEQARHLNGLVRERLIATGEVDEEHTVLVRGGQHVGVGDQIATRENNWALRTEQGVHVKNRHRWTVQEVGEDGSITVSDPSRGSVVLPGEYARAQVELAYFRTTHGVQSLTQDVGGSLVDQGAGFRDVYVGMTRGRRSNTAYVVIEPGETSEQVLARALGRDRADLGVLAVRDRLAGELRLERERQANAPKPITSGEHSAELADAAHAPPGLGSSGDVAPVGPVAAREGVRVPDPLARRRLVLGEERSAQLGDLAAAHAGWAAGLGRGELVAERDSAARAWDRLDTGGALETRRLRIDRQAAQGSVEKYLALAGGYDQLASETSRVRGRSERRTLRQAAAVQRQIAAGSQRDVERLTQAEQQLHHDGRHPDDWIDRDGDHAARWLAVERELATRRELAVTDAVEQAITAPPERLLEQIGGPPDPGAPLRADWENLARRLEHDHQIAQAAATDHSPPPVREASDKRDLERRIRRYLRDSHDLGQIERLQRASFPQAPQVGGPSGVADGPAPRRREPPGLDLGFDR